MAFGSQYQSQNRELGCAVVGDTNGLQISYTIELLDSGNGAFQLLNDQGQVQPLINTTATNSQPYHYQIRFRGYDDAQAAFLPAAIKQGAVKITITSNHSFDTVSGRKEVTLNLTGQIFDEPNAVFTLDDIPILGVDVPTYSNSTEVVPGQTGLSSTHSRMRLTVDHPYADEGGTSLDQTTDYNVKPVGNYVVGASFGEITRSQQLKTAQGRLQDLLVDNSGATDLQRTSQSLYVMGLSWLRQTALTTDILDSVSGTRKQSAHRVGVIGQEESYFVDFRTQFSSTNTRKANSGIPGALFPSNSFTGSALEHGVLEQLQGSDKNVASTISIVADAVNSGDKVFMFDGSMSQNAKDDLMINGNYSASFVNGREFELQQNIFDYLLLPAVEAEIDDWNGQGYVGFRQDGIGGNILMGINGDLIDQPIGGGFPTSAGGIDFYAVGGNAEINTVYSALDFSTASTSCGPVNFNTGDKLESITDMVAGNLVFSRNYNSREHRVKTDIGPGWRHSFDITRMYIQMKTQRWDLEPPQIWLRC